GPAFPGEPTAFVQGRRLSAPASADTFTSPPYGGVYAKVDLAREVLTIDLGNFSPTVREGPIVPAEGWPIRPSKYRIGLPFAALGAIDFTARTYSDFAGIVEIPIPSAQLSTVQTTPLLLVDETDGHIVPAVQEHPLGLYVDVSRPFVRLNAGDKETVVL